MSRGVSGGWDDSSSGHCSLNGGKDRFKPVTSDGKRRLWSRSVHLCLLSGIIIRELRALRSVDGCGDTLMCHPHTPSVKNLLPQLLGSYWLTAFRCQLLKGIISSAENHLVQGYAFWGVDHIQGLIGEMVLMSVHRGLTRTTKDHSGSGAPTGASQGQACISTQCLPLSSPASFHSLSQVTIPKPLLDTHTMHYELHLRASFPGNPT